MKFAYKFSNLLGTVYRKGNVLFTPDGNSIISPVGNRISIYDLKNNKTKTLSLESSYNYNAIDISPNGCLMVAVNEDGQAQMISMVSQMVIDTYKFRNKVRCVKFSPNGKYFAVSHENCLAIFLTPGEISNSFNSFVLKINLVCANDDITTIDWSYDSKIIAVGTRDNTTKILGVEYLTNFRRYTLGGHSTPIVGCFFESRNLNLYTVSQNGQLCIWECTVTSDELEITDVPVRDSNYEPNIKKTRQSNFDEEDDVDIAEAVESTNPLGEKLETAVNAVDDENINRDEQGKLIAPQAAVHPFNYSKINRHYLATDAQKENRNATLTAVTYHKKLKLLVTAFSTGSFYLYEMPDVNMIHSLSISEYGIDSVSFNMAGDWIVLASTQLGQMLVWEWQSEQYIMKQQGHSSEMTCISYSPDGQYIATGGEDAKVKLWNVNNGFCIVTFKEHSSCITDVQFSNNKKFVVSASLDGTVRAYDIIRYRNFRTLTTPQPVQFASVAIDVSGEFVAAGGQDVFEIFLWSMKLGRLLEIVSGHEGPVVSLKFSPVITSTCLISASWDKTIKIWNCLESSSEHESIDMMSDALCVAFKPNGEEVAVSTLNGHISVFDVKTSQQLALIEGRDDLGSGRSDEDLVTAKKNSEGKAFTSITYSADGECILAAGKSKNVCIYNVKEKMLLKKFEISQNYSLDGMHEFINRRNLTEFGNLALIEEREELEGGKTKIRLPGVKSGDMAARNFKPEINVFSVKFSPTGQSWAAATTEGLLTYSLDKGIIFDPYQLSMEITPKATRENLRNKEYSAALLMALKLNESVLVQEIIEGIPHENIDLIIATLPDEFAHRTLKYIIKFISGTKHIEYYLKWGNKLITHLGQQDNILTQETLLSLQQNLSRKYEMLSRICDFNKYTLKVMKDIAKAKAEQSEQKNGTAGSGDEMDNDDDDGLLLMKRVDDSDDAMFTDDDSD